jgi:hypothetical protein
VAFVKDQWTRAVKRADGTVARGEYADPRAGSVRFDEVLDSWFRSRSVDPSTLINYEKALRLHVRPVFGQRMLNSIRPSEIATWLVDLENRIGAPTARTGVHRHTWQP